MEIDVIKCKYKFQDEEKFDGKPYCTLQNELCEDISFACDTNCQVYEDYKQLHRYKQVIKEIKEIVEKIDDSGGCAYGDYDCDNCSSLEQETVCTYKVKKLIIQKCEEVK